MLEAAASACPYARQSGRKPPEAGSRSLEDVEREAIEATLKATRNQIGRRQRFWGSAQGRLLEKKKRKYGWV